MHASVLSALFVNECVKDKNQLTELHLKNDAFATFDSFFVDHVFNSRNKCFVRASRYNSQSQGRECIPTTQTEKPHSSSAGHEKTDAGSLTW